MRHPWGFASPTASVIGQKLLYVLWGASIVALHAFVWVIKTVAIRSTLQQGQKKEGFTLLICPQSKPCEYIVGKWCRQVQAVTVGVLATHQEEDWHDQTVFTHFTGTGEGWVGNDVELLCHSSFVRVCFGPAQRNENPICVVTQFQFGLEKAAKMLWPLCVLGLHRIATWDTWQSQRGPHSSTL